MSGRHDKSQTEPRRWAYNDRAWPRRIRDDAPLAVGMWASAVERLLDWQVEHQVSDIELARRAGLASPRLARLIAGYELPSQD